MEKERTEDGGPTRQYVRGGRRKRTSRGQLLLKTQWRNKMTTNNKKERGGESRGEKGGAKEGNHVLGEHKFVRKKSPELA